MTDATLAPSATAPRPAPRPQSSLGEFISRLFREKPLGAFGLLVFLVMLLTGVFADVIAPEGYNAIDPINRLKPPSWEHWFGTDQLGRSLFARIVHGAQLSVIIAFSATALSIAISVVLGVTAGYFGGVYDMIVQRLVDAWMSFPDLIILIVAVAVLGPGMWQVILVLGLLYGIAGSRVVRGAVLSVRQNTYIQASESIGSSNLWIMRRHVLPNIMAPVTVLFTTRLAAVILAESGLSFLGLGIPPPAPSWGGMLSLDGRSYMFLAPWLAIAPGVALTVTVYGINVFGDAMRDLLDPRMRGGGGRFGGVAP